MFAPYIVSLYPPITLKHFALELITDICVEELQQTRHIAVKNRESFSPILKSVAVYPDHQITAKMSTNNYFGFTHGGTQYG